MAHFDAREGKWRGNWRMEWVANTLHTTSEHGVSSITTADAHTSAASSRLNWRPRRFKWTRPFRRKTISGFCACAVTFQLASAYVVNTPVSHLWPSSFKSPPGYRLSWEGYRDTPQSLYENYKKVSHIRFLSDPFPFSPNAPRLMQ